ncbi:type IV pilus biogenesis protein PilM [Burkholderia contaminans]|uniref:type IV pilus biogenesis protein PilM n=1 Tax=Burkholderia cepacia complex TaxID=87882 RepID=UPI001CF23A44|nr:MULTISPECIES: type IV pilus biogenesis protein PilM [Burkholderia cepacia complex]MCA7888841.1 type IV pilus biogenesis protein PilM [Burkholderia contaminans]MDN7576533.1 type IV pilus biogenesis protein PilM [Burkholderia contaminans]MDN7669920.1 type IV pilus biogenesis protein PilM [Burkholderia vietnamiensis]
MRYLPLLVVAIALATGAYLSSIQQMVQPSSYTVSSAAAASQFLAYRSAVMAYMNSNPSYTGVIQAAQLAVYSPQYSPTFVSSYGAGNAVSPSGTGRLITVYAALPAGTLRAVLAQSNNDASLGLSSGSTWTTAADGMNAVPQPLNVTVPVGNVVSVVKTGN